MKNLKKHLLIFTLALAGVGTVGHAQVSITNMENALLAEGLTQQRAQEIINSFMAFSAPSGGIIAYAGTNVPAGWRLCDGAPVNAATNSAYLGLLAAIGKTYGVGDGTSLSFNLPDLRGRTLAGKDDMGGTIAGRMTATGTGNPGIAGATLGATGGVDRLTLTTPQMPTHNHSAVTANAGGHTHTTTVTHYRSNGELMGDLPGRNSDNDNPKNFTDTSSYAGDHNHAVTIFNTGGSEPHPIVQPTIILNYIIKL